jgi:hypothetical protein
MPYASPSKSTCKSIRWQYDGVLPLLMPIRGTEKPLWVANSYSCHAAQSSLSRNMYLARGFLMILQSES